LAGGERERWMDLTGGGGNGGMRWAGREKGPAFIGALALGDDG
jgi:hypothetical protein